MDVAVDAKGQRITIDQVRKLAAVPSLWCGGKTPDKCPCEVPVHPRALTSDVVRPHFAGRHKPGCDRGSTPSVDRVGDRGHASAQGRLREIWTILDATAQRSSGPDGRRRPDPQNPGTKTRRSFVPKLAGDSIRARNRTLEAILLELVDGIDTTGVQIKVAGGHLRPSDDVFLHAADPRLELRSDNVTHYWGVVSECRPTRYGGLMCILEEAPDGLAVLLTEHLLPEFDLTAESSIAGRHILARGYFKNSSNGPYLQAAGAGAVAITA